MVTNLGDLISDLSMDEPIAWRRVRITPLRLQRMAKLEYLTLDDSASETLITVEETSASGSVPELRVRNRAKSCVLIPEGSTLIGAKQNRAVNLSVMVAPESVTVIPVSCVERGRWRFLTPHCGYGAFAGGPLRAMMCAGTTESLNSIGKVQVDQAAVWGHVADMLGSAGVSSPTQAYHALYENWHQELADYEAHLRLPESACGVAVEIDGLLETVDLFDKPNTLHKLWARLVRSYLLTALRPEVARGRKTDVREFLERVLSSPGQCHKLVGVGTTVRLTNAEAEGAALLCDGQLVHLSVFANSVPNEGGSEAPPCTAEGKELGNEFKLSNSRRPWWRFWA